MDYNKHSNVMNFSCSNKKIEMKQRLFVSEVFLAGRDNNPRPYDQLITRNGKEIKKLNVESNMQLFDFRASLWNFPASLRHVKSLFYQ